MRAFPFWLPLIVVLLCIVLYGFGLGGVLMFDSSVVLTDNTQLHLDPGEFMQWRNATLSTNTGPSGRPVSMLTFAVNYASFGSVWPFGFKLVNLVIHCLTGLLAWQFLRALLHRAPCTRLSRRRAEWLALTAAALWLLHPLHVSSVLYTVQRMEQLSAVFTLLGLCAYLHYRPRWLQRKATASELSDCALLLLLATLSATYSKEDGILLLPLLLLVELVFFRCRYDNRESRFLILASGFALFMPLLLIIFLWWLQPEWLTARYAVREFTLSERLLTQSRVLWQYLGWIFVPDIRPLGLHHDNVTLSSSLLQPTTTLLAMAAWILLLIAAIFSWRRWPVCAFVLGWYLIAHSLEASVVPLELVYEHRNYLALLGPCLLTSWALWCAVPSLRRRPRAVLAGLLGLILAIQLGSRASLWADEEQLAAYHLYHHPDSLRSVYHFANIQLRLGEAATDAESASRRLTVSRKFYEDILRLDPTDMPALATLLYLDSRYFSSLDSERWIGELAELAGHHSMRRNDEAAMGLLLDCLIQRWCDMPGDTYQQMLHTLAARYPDDPLYFHMLARYFGQVENDYEQAISTHRQLLDRHPNYTEARAGLVAWNSLAGNRDQMLENMGALLRLDPDPVQVQQIKTVLRPPAN
jgi:hypothetical protein